MDYTKENGFHKRLLDGLGHALIVTDSLEKILYWNRAAEELYGWSAGEAMGRSVVEITSSADLVERAEEIMGELKAGRSWTGEFAARRKDGTRFPALVTDTPVQDQQGNLVAIIGVSTDITEIKQTEELSRSEELFGLLDEVVKEYAIFMLDPEGCISNWSAGAERMKGYRAEEIVGRHFSVFYTPEDIERGHPEEELRIAKELGHYEEEGFRVRKDGSRLYASVLITALHDEEGNLRGFSKVVRNVTERRRYEDELKEAHRTAAEAGQAAEEANRAKSEFLANMSHEIRTPMNGVIGMIGLLIDTDLDEEQREYAETVRSSADNLLTIINDILDFSKIEAGKMDIEIIAFDLRTAVEESVGLLAERAHYKGLEIASLVEAEVPTALKGDPGRIRQVLVNLLGNAVKFTEEGEVTLMVRLVEESDEEAVIRFEVKDTGIGMTEEQRGRLFQSFSQADASMTRRYGGTGLGLAISKQLVELMGGEIGVESEPGAGSTFFFALPLKKQREGAKKPEASTLHDLKVLVVDDNETNRRIVHEQVASWGMRDGMAEDGQRALEVLREAAESNEPYDLAILDMQMLEMDGVELARRIKEDPAIAPTKLVMASSVGRGREAERAMEAGVEVYLVKPVRQSRLYAALATVMATPPPGEETVREDEKPLTVPHEPKEAKARFRARVLVAEDNRVNQMVAVKMLEKLGYRADVAADGQEAVEALFSLVPYAAVLMDVQMPEMNGYEATAEIRRREREDPNGRRTPIIAMTANAMQGDREKALSAGMDDYVAKPVKPEELDAALERWIPRYDEETLASEEATDGAGALPDDATETLDSSVIEGLFDLGGDELLEELADLFLEDVPPRLEALREAIGSGDAPSVGQVAHALKGSSGNMGATRMASICAKLEAVGISEDLTKAPKLLDQLEAEFSRVRPALLAAVKS